MGIRTLPTEEASMLLLHCANGKGIPVNTDRESQLLIGNLAQYAATLPAQNMIDFTQDGVAYQMTANSAIDLNNQVSARVQNPRSIEAKCFANIDSGMNDLRVDAAFAALP
jgi:hypothetical protein